MNRKVWGKGGEGCLDGSYCVMKYKQVITIVALFIIVFLWHKSAGAQGNLLRTRSWLERGNNFPRGSFNENGIALDDEARQGCVELYQMAINEVLKWADERELNADKIEIFGSLIRRKRKPPRFGTYKGKSWPEAKLLSLLEEGPSDLDVTMLFTDAVATKRFKQSITDLKTKIFNAYGVILQVELEANAIRFGYDIHDYRGKRISIFKGDRFVIWHGYKVRSSRRAAPAVKPKSSAKATRALTSI